MIFSGKTDILGGKKRKSDFDEEPQKETEQPFLSGFSAILIFSFGVFFSCLLSFALQAGRFIEYRIPLFLMEMQTTLISVMACLFFLAVLSGLAIQRSLGFEDSRMKVLSRSQRISYFFSLLTTFGFTIYLCAVLVYYLKTGHFMSECLYLIVLFAGIIVVHLKARKGPLAHMFTSAAFIVILAVTAFYGGIASAKIESKHLTNIQGEMYALAAAQESNYILAGFDPHSNKINGKLIILPPQSPLLEQNIFFPLAPAWRKDR